MAEAKRNPALKASGDKRNLAAVSKENFRPNQAPASAGAGATSSAPAPQTIELAAFGGGELGYIRMIRACDARAMFPQCAELPDFAVLYALFAADGSPMMIADNREVVLSGAWQYEINVVKLH